ncbi:MAG: DegT/DnrJ/EryC1/StrS family aminotransferase, partial [Alphaproteobacteria bacterium]|nr:DegT/DnrJ/EryC1/StrS family aminotransferase [Alphaproteobacteria bacterium]
ADLGVVRPMPRPPHSESVAWLYTVEISGDTAGARDLQAYLAARGIETRPLWEPMHMSRAHRGALALGGSVAAALYRDCLSLPSSVGLTDTQRASVVEAIRTYLAANHVKSRIK